MTQGSCVIVIDPAQAKRRAESCREPAWKVTQWLYQQMQSWLALGQAAVLQLLSWQKPVQRCYTPDTHNCHRSNLDYIHAVCR